MAESYECRFLAPFTSVIAGGTGSGKSTFTHRLIENASEMIFPPPERIYYVYGEWSPAFENIKCEGIHFRKGLDESLISADNLEGKRTLLILDDLQDTIDPNLISALFCRISHHRHVSVCFLVQNLYYRGLKTMREVNLNTQYLILFKQVRDKASVSHLARQMYPTSYKYAIQAYEDSTSQPHSYLLLDCKQGTPDHIRLRSFIFPGEQTVCYLNTQDEKQKKYRDPPHPTKNYEPPNKKQKTYQEPVYQSEMESDKS